MRSTICAVIFLALLVGDLAGAATKYVIKDLGVLSGDNSSSAYAINGKGQIIGSSSFVKMPLTELPPSRVFLWEDGRMTEIKWLSKAADFIGADINDSGAVLIYQFAESFVVQKGKATKIKPPGGSLRDMTAYEINNRGEVVGVCRGGGKVERPFLWKNGVSEALEMPSDLGRVDWMLINDKGQIAATVEKADKGKQIVQWEDGKMKVLADTSGSYHAADLADDGTIVGRLAMSYRSGAFAWRNGVFKDLRAPEGLKSGGANCINSKGTIAGVCYTEKGKYLPVVWDKDGVPTVLPTLRGGDCLVADMNDGGVIVGAAEDAPTEYHAVMWTPVK